MEKLPFVGGSGHASALTLCPREPDFFSWGFARHPCDRALSVYAAAWQHGKRGASGWGLPDKFPDFILGLPESGKKMIHNRPQSNFLCDKSGTVMVDFVGRFENIDKDWEHVLEKIGVKHVNLPRRNATKHRPWQRCFNNEMIEKMHEVYELDFKLFEYE